MTFESVPVGDEDHHRFFGYYDTCPWDASGRRLLAHEVKFSNRKPTPDDEASVVVIDQTSDVSQQIGMTTAWNFQIGAKLQWLGPDYDHEVLFNNRVDGDLGARIVNVDTGQVRTISRPVYTTLPNGKLAITLDFAHLHRTRPGYGYPPHGRHRARDDEALSVIDLGSDTVRTLVSFEQLKGVAPVKTMDDGRHWVNHVSVSSNGERVAFLHRWELADGGMYSRLCSIRPDGSSLRVVADTGRITHYAWRTDEEILAWAREGSVISDAEKHGWFDEPLVRPVINAVRRLFGRAELPSWMVQDVLGEGYFLYRVDGSEPRELDLHDSDGHPSFSPDGEWVVFDTYPTSDGQRELYLYGFESGEKHVVGSFHSPSEYDNTGYRCDLHPRWSRDGTKLCIDSAHTGSREMYTIDVSGLVNG